MTNLEGPIGIKNIIFDFGGVILNISHNMLEDAFRVLGLHNFDDLFNQAQQSELFQKFEKGEISPHEFRNELRRITNLKISDEVIDETWNQIIGDYPAERIDLLKKIKGNYRLFLFSNTNQIHYDFYIEKFRKEFGFEFSTLFHNTYWSFKMGKRKPETDSYLEILTNEKLCAAETLFIDDSKQNINAAIALGLKTLHLQNGMEITDFFRGSSLLIEFTENK